MLATIVKKVFGTKNDRELKRISRLVAGVNTHGDAMAELDDGALQAKTAELKAALADGMATLRQDGWEKALDGRTTVDEVVRVTKSDRLLK